MQAKLTILSQPDSNDFQYVRDQLHEYNTQQSQDDEHQSLAVFARDEAGQILGGLLGDTYWGWLYVALLWVREDARRLGLGSSLLAEAEAEAVRRGCRHAHLDTHDFQAPEFYKKHGYRVWGMLDDLPPGHQRIFMKKDLGAQEK